MMHVSSRRLKIDLIHVFLCYESDEILVSLICSLGSAAYDDFSVSAPYALAECFDGYKQIECRTRRVCVQNAFKKSFPLAKSRRRLPPTFGLRLITLAKCILSS